MIWTPWQDRVVDRYRGGRIDIGEACALTGGNIKQVRNRAYILREMAREAEKEAPK